MKAFEVPSFIVSVQAEAHEPLASLPVMLALCESCLQGGAEALRLADLDLIAALRKRHPNLPLIGLHKPTPLPQHPAGEVYITRTLQNALDLAAAGVDAVALDATPRKRFGESRPLAEMIKSLKLACPNILVMGDVDSLESAVFARDAGVDILSTTLAGYTTETQGLPPTDAPAMGLLAALVQRFPGLPVILEGRIWEPAQVAEAFSLGAHGVVIGSAITRPHHITARFKRALPNKD